MLMYLDSAARSSAETPRRRGSCQPTTSAAPTERRRAQPTTATTTTARRTRLDDAIVSQWLLDQVRPVATP
jgi:hypothetical protein